MFKYGLAFYSIGNPKRLPLNLGQDNQAISKSEIYIKFDSTNLLSNRAAAAPVPAALPSHCLKFRNLLHRMLTATLSILKKKEERKKYKNKHT